MICKTANCQRATRPGHAYCADCIGPVLRTGRPPVLTREPEWMRRRRVNGLTAKDLTAEVLGR